MQWRRIALCSFPLKIGGRINPQALRYADGIL
jgi:hypothetical protein